MRNVITAGILFFFISINAECAIRVAGKTAQEMFPDSRVAALADAAANGRVDEILALLKEGVPIDAEGYRRATPLTFAVLAPNLAGTETLLKNGANPNHRIDDPAYVNGLPIVMFLGRANQPDLLSLMLRYGANPNARSPVRASTADKFPYEGDSLLIESVMIFQNVKLLVQAGADVNFRPQSNPNATGGHTAASNAAALGQFDVLEFLLDHGATVDLDEIAHTLQIRSWSPEFRARRIRILERLHAMGAHIYRGYKPMRRQTVEIYANADTPEGLVTQGFYEPKEYLGDIPVSIAK